MIEKKQNSNEMAEGSQSFKLLTRPEHSIQYQARIGMNWLAKPGPIIVLLSILFIISAVEIYYPFAPPLLLEIVIGILLTFVFFSGPHRLYTIEYYLNEIWKLSSEFITEIDRIIVDRTTRDFTKWIIVQMLCGIMFVTIAVQPIEFILSTAWIVSLVSIIIVAFGYIISNFTFKWIEKLTIRDIDIGN